MTKKLYNSEHSSTKEGIHPTDMVFEADEAIISASSIEIDDDFDIDVIDSVMETNSPFVLQTTKESVLQDSLSAYIDTISSFPQLPPDELAVLMVEAKEKGDKKAMMLIVSHHLRLVVWIAMTFQRRWHQNLQDLIQEGNLGLLRALEKFEPEKGIKFSYYATFWVKAYILKFLMSNWRLVKIGTTQTQRKLFYTLNRERQKLLSMGFAVDTALLAQHFDVSEESIIEMQQRLEGADVSVNVDPSEDTNSPVIHLSSEGSTEELLAREEIQEQFAAHLEALYGTLNANEKVILQERILSDSPTTLKILGEQLSISRERVRQIETRLLKKIREHLDKKLGNLTAEWLL